MTTLNLEAYPKLHRAAKQLHKAMTQLEVHRNTRDPKQSQIEFNETEETLIGNITAAKAVLGIALQMAEGSGIGRLETPTLQTQNIGKWG